MNVVLDYPIHSEPSAMWSLGYASVLCDAAMHLETEDESSDCKLKRRRLCSGLMLMPGLRSMTCPKLASGRG